MFEHVFSELLERIPGIECIGVWGKDGLELEKQFGSNPATRDMELFGAEIADIVTRISTISFDNYTLEYQTSHFKAVVFSLTPDCFLLVFGQRNMLSGKLRFFVELQKQKIVEAM